MHQYLSFLQCCEKTWCIYIIFFVLQFGQFQLAQGEIYLIRYLCSQPLLLYFQIISYDSPRGGVSVITEKGDVTASFLVVQHARPSDSGTYSCSPSVGETVSVNVHVLRGNVICQPQFYFGPQIQ